MKKAKKALLLLLTAALILSSTGCHNENTQQDFDAFIEDEFVSTMQSDYITAHSYLQKPEDFGVDVSKLEVSLGLTYSDEDLELAKESVNASYDAFKAFNRSSLTSEQQDTYDIYNFQITLSKKLNDDKFDYYAGAFESMGGIHYQLPVLFADWEVRSEQDVIDLITLLGDVKPYVDTALEYTKKQEEKGLLMVDFDSVIDYCNGILEKGENSSILSSMKDSIAALNLGEEKTEQYTSQLQEAFRSSFLPAYEAIRSTMQQLKETGTNNTEGLAKFEHGKEYFELLLQQNIGSNKSVDEIRRMMENAYDSHLSKLQSILLQNPDAMDAMLAYEFPETGYTSYADIMNDIQSKFFNEFPAVNDLTFNIVDINEEIASDSGVTAYFNIPTIDGNPVKQLRVNPTTNDVTSIATYATVAHEGFPGHMYQYAYLYENTDSNYRKVLADSLAYTEGFAVYAQYEAFRYLDSVDPALLAAYRENELLTYCAIILMDIGIHYDGWSFEDFKTNMALYGFVTDDDEAMREQYNQLQANPCAFEPYYVGYHEIVNLKGMAQTELGDLFDEKEFNEALLKSGAAPFSVVQKNIEEYIETAAYTDAQFAKSAA